ncbi:MAG: hypothetical protein OEW15_07080 [Nitrospirota bacterium]|nr:hypothetical protein [Nitrospirota bacterium]
MMIPRPLHHTLPLIRIYNCLSVLAVLLFLSAAVADAAAEPINALLLRDIPPSYSECDRFLSSLQDTGANTVIIELPFLSDDRPDLFSLHNLVYLAHRAGLKILVILPIRQYPSILTQHPEWADREYDPNSGSIREIRKLDLFVDDAVKYMASIAANLSEYSIDGILLSDDFMYGTFEGMSKQAIQESEKRLGTDVKPKVLFKRNEKPAGNSLSDQYGAQFQSWVAIKRDRMLETYDTIRKAVQSAAKRPIITGVTVPVILPISSAEELLTRYAFDMSGLKRLNVDLYWTVIEVRNYRDTPGMSYKQSLELLSRAVHSAVTSIRDESKTVIIIPAAAAGGYTVTLSELEESTSLLKHNREIGLGYAMTPLKRPASLFLQKMFRRIDR